MAKTKLQYQKYLNSFYGMFEYEDVIKDFEHISVQYKSYDSFKHQFTYYYYAKYLGKLLRMKDPIAFNVGYNEWRAE